MSDALKNDTILTCAELCNLESNSYASVAGFVIVKQMPSTAKGTVFLTLEDETGTSNIICWNSVYRKFRDQVVFSSFLLVSGQLQRENEVSHLIASNVRDISGLLKLIPNIKKGDPIGSVDQ